MEGIAALDRFAGENGIYRALGAPMSEYTSFKIGGPADILLEPAGVSQLEAALSFCREHGVACRILGRGSNVLVSDSGVRGAVVRLGNRFSEMEIVGRDKIVCAAGASLAALCRMAMENGLAGVEFAYGIPGSVGGAVYMNAGAYGGETKDVCERAEYIDKDGVTGGFGASELDFSYRHSVFSGGGRCITSAVFRLAPGEKSEINAKMEELLAKRFDKQPMDMPSAGSTFKRPEGAFASALIDKCGLKGFRVGGAEVSEKHAGFVVNAGGASCRDVLELIDKVKERVLKDTGFVLEPEVEIWGET